MKKITINNFNKNDRCKICNNKNCTGYEPVNVALDSTAYVETCDNFIMQHSDDIGEPILYNEPKAYDINKYR